MLRCMYSGISGMKNNQQKLDVIGNNLANVSTTAFKSSRAEFADMLYQNAGYASAPTMNKGGANAKQIGLGAKLSSINRIMSQGNALSTGRSLDVCIDGEGFFIVGNGVVDYTSTGIALNADTMGMESGDMQINFTRDGNFALDKDGNLITSDGYRVMGYLLTSSYYKNGKEVNPPSASSSLDANGEARFVNADGVLKAASGIESGITTGSGNGNGNGSSGTTTTDADNIGSLQALRIPDEVYVPEYTDSKGNTQKSGYQKVVSFSIGKDGIITATLANETTTALGQIATAQFKNPEGLKALGGNLYEVSANSGSAVVRTVTNVENDNKGTQLDSKPVNDNSKSFGDTIQGCLEASNVDITEQFTDMITATRAFQASSKVITTSDEILQTVTGLIR